jgi:hypothetical protein
VKVGTKSDSVFGIIVKKYNDPIFN